MRLYGQKFLKNAAEKAARQSTETRDAILWDVITTDRVCRVKIQGSNELIIARFPQNWATIPSWCKPGQAVRIIHKGGSRGYIEVMGYGRAIPTPVSGGGTPPVATPQDAVVRGCAIRAIPSGPRMMVWVEVGTVRFAGVVKTVPPVSIANGGSLIAADMGMQFGSVSGIFNITAPSAGQFRYDAFSVGPDLIVVKTSGPAFTTTESKPSIPAGNILLGYLLVKGGQTSISADDIAAAWSAPVASQLVLSAVDNGSTWTIAANVKDQWGAGITTSGGWTVKAEIEDGDGSLDASSNNTGSGSSCSFIYTEGTAGTVVTFHLSVAQGEVALDSYVTILL